MPKGTGKGVKEIKIARVFPRITKATPKDELCFFEPPGMFLPEIDEVHVSVSFTYDIPKAEQLAEQWRHIAPVKVGGPAYNEPGGEFIQGRYLKPGYTITSRGCPNRCWFCQVWRREGGEIRELPIVSGNNILDDNLLACSEGHIKAVFSMLKQQKWGRPMFTGGLEAKILKDWHVALLREIRPETIFFAYDTPDDYEPLVEAGKKLLKAGFITAAGKPSRVLRCYVLIGYPQDTYEKATNRLTDTIKAGFFPMAMLYLGKECKRDRGWARFQREWARPAIVNTKLR